jgi:putative endonuclease
LARNYRCPRGEIDLIALDKETVVFVEVKARQDIDLADPEENVRLSKQRRLTAIARHWLQRHDAGDRACRFDVIAVLVGPGKPTVRHIPDAFQPLA